MICDKKKHIKNTHFAAFFTSKTPPSHICHSFDGVSFFVFCMEQKFQNRCIIQLHKLFESHCNLTEEGLGVNLFLVFEV